MCVLQFLGSQRIGDCKSVQIEYSNIISCGQCPFVWSPSLCVCVTFYLGLHVRLKVVLGNPKFSKHTINGAAIFLSSYFPIPPLFNTTTLIKPMNEEEEKSPLEGPRIRRNRLAQERHATWSKEQRAADANRRVTQRAASNNVLIATDATRWAAQRTAHSDV